MTYKQWEYKDESTDGHSEQDTAIIRWGYRSYGSRSRDPRCCDRIEILVKADCVDSFLKVAIDECRISCSGYVVSKGVQYKIAKEDGTVISSTIFDNSGAALNPIHIPCRWKDDDEKFVKWMIYAGDGWDEVKQAASVVDMFRHFEVGANKKRMDVDDFRKFDSQEVQRCKILFRKLFNAFKSERCTLTLNIEGIKEPLVFNLDKLDESKTNWKIMD